VHDLLYANQDRWWTQATRNPSKVIKDLAKQIPGLDQAKFEDCVDSKRMQAKVQAHLALAEQYQIGSTPTFIIGGKKYPGSLPFDEIKKLVDEAAAAAPAPTDTTKKTPTP
jgi:protein-disulfide isomerase